MILWSGAGSDVVDGDAVGASSTAIVRASMRTPLLAAQYGELVGMGRSSWTLETLMMRPGSPCETICFAASWHPSHGPVRLTAMT